MGDWRTTLRILASERFPLGHLGHEEAIVLDDHDQSAMNLSLTYGQRHPWTELRWLGFANRWGKNLRIPWLGGRCAETWRVASPRHRNFSREWEIPLNFGLSIMRPVEDGKSEVWTIRTVRRLPALQPSEEIESPPNHRNIDISLNCRGSTRQITCKRSRPLCLLLQKFAILRLPFLYSAPLQSVTPRDPTSLGLFFSRIP